MVGAIPGTSVPCMRAPAIETRDLHMHYGKGRTEVRALDGIDRIASRGAAPALSPVLRALVGFAKVDLGGFAGTSASVLQYTSFGETWYRGVSVAATRRFTNRHQLMMSYTLSKAEDNGTDFQSEFIAQDSGRGRNPDDLNGLPLGFNPALEKGPSVQDQRHRRLEGRQLPIGGEDVETLRE